MQRCIIFAHYDIDGKVDAHVRYLLEQLRRHATRVVFVSTSATQDELDQLKGLCDTALSRPNVGYDFMSWKTGVALLDDPAQFDEILFVNDSIYGPLFDLGRVFRRAEKLTTDFWGLTASRQHCPHVQSFFFAFRKNLIDNGIFQAFWESVDILDDKDHIIQRYEIGMTHFMEARGVQWSCLFDAGSMSTLSLIIAALTNGARPNRSRMGTIRWYLKKDISDPINPMHYFWRTALKNGIPFIKVELLMKNPLGISLEKIYSQLEQLSYDHQLIINHIKRINRVTNQAKP